MMETRVRPVGTLSSNSLTSRPRNRGQEDTERLEEQTPTLHQLGIDGVNIVCELGEPLLREAQHWIESMSVYVGRAPHLGTRWVRLDFNPAGMTSGGDHPCPTGELQSVLAVLWDWFGKGHEILTPLQECRVTRLDVARDFQVADTSIYISGLRRAPRPYDPKESFEERKGVRTLTIGFKRNHVNLYDRGAKYPRLGAGILRWEVQSRGWHRKTMPSVADINQASVEAFAIDRWSWSHAGMEILDRATTVKRVMDLQLSPTKTRNLLGDLLLQSQGMQLAMSSETRADHRRMLRQLGIALTPDALFDRAEARCYRLDFASGTEEVS